MRIVSWQRALTEHQVHTWRALQRHLDEPIRTVVVERQSRSRQQQGWTPPDLSGLHLEILPPGMRGLVYAAQIILEEPVDAVHVFGNLWGVRRFILLICFALLVGRRVAVMNEPYACVPFGYLKDESRYAAQFKRIVRPLAYRSAAFLTRAIARRERILILAISEIAALQFRTAGFAPMQIAPWAYFVPRKDVVGLKGESHERLIRLIYVGSLIECKGLSLLVAAFRRARARGARIELDIYGPGNADRIIPSDVPGLRYCGRITFGSAQDVIPKYHALILPSWHDGWGVVVNEALLQRVPVIVSDGVGAGCVVLAKKAGTVFPVGDVDALVNILKDLDESTLAQWRCGAEKAASSLLPAAGAEYLIGVLKSYFCKEAAMPISPWLESL